MTKRNLLEGPFTAIARAQSKHWGVTIRATGAALSTDGDVINFPWNADDIDSIPFDVLNGYLDHEVGHVAEEREHRDAGKATPLELLKAQRGQTVRMLLNVFEDIRMEIKRGQIFPGVAANLHAANLYSVEQFRRKIGRDVSKAKNFWHTIGCAIIMEARDVSTDWLPVEYGPYLDLCRPEIKASRTIRWGADSLELARRVYEKLQDHADKVQKRAEQGEPGEDEGASAAGVDGDLSEITPGDGDPMVAVPGQGDGEPSEADLELAEGAFQEAETDHIMDEVGEKINQASMQKAQGPEGYVPNPDALAADRWIEPRTDSDHDAEYQQLKEQVSKQVSALRAKLLRIVRNRTECRPLCDQEHGRLDTSNLHQLRLGNRRVFRRTQKGEEMDTAVSILIDLSGSMSGAKIKNARLTAVALAETFDSLGLPFEIIGFHNDCYRSVSPRPGFVNRSPLEFHKFKTFDQSFRKARRNLATIRSRYDNVDGEAVMAVAKRLARRPEQRKIMFVISDGQPACMGADHVQLSKHLKRTIKDVRAAGIELFGIGLSYDEIAEYYGDDNSIAIRDVSRMAESIYKVVRARLLARRRAA